MNRSLVFTFFGRDTSAGSTMRKLGGIAQTSSRHVDGCGASLARWAKRGALAATVAGGFAARQILKIGMAYQDSLNVFKAVSHATGEQMQLVADKAKALGANLKLPATSAADAAAAMTELAKGGLNVRQSMGAALGTLQLATAAQVDGAQAAKIQSAALNQFGLKGRAAGHVADVLANAANAAQGEITDMAAALNYVGPVARSTGISLDDTATAVGLLAKNGILGSMAGTSLRGMLTSMASPSKKAAGALKALGVVAYDSQGNFVGLRKITDELSKARERLTHQAFAAATADAFQKRNLAAVNILAQSGVKAWDHMGTAVTREGGAAAVAGAKMKGLHGALQGLQSQLETVAISIYQKVSPSLERIARFIAAKGIPAVVTWAGEMRQRLAPTLSKLRDAVVEFAGRAVKFAQAVGGILREMKPLAVLAGGALLLALRGVSAVMGFLTRHTDLLRGLIYALAAGFIAYKGALIVAKGAQIALNAVEKTSIFLTGGLTTKTVALKDATYASAAANDVAAGSAATWAARIGRLGPIALATAASIGILVAATKSANEASYTDPNGQTRFKSNGQLIPGSKFSAPGGKVYIPSQTKASSPSGPTTPAPGQHRLDTNDVSASATKHHKASGGSSKSSPGGAGVNVAPSTSGTGTYTPPGDSPSSPAAKAAKHLTHVTHHQAMLLAHGLLTGFRGGSQHVLGQLTFGLQDQFNNAAARIEHGLQRWTDRVKRARDKMLADIKARKSMAAQIRESVIGGADLSGAFTQDDAGNTLLGNVGTFLSGKLAELKTFAANLGQLRKAGLGTRLLAMVANLGPTQGIQVANQILSGVAGSIASLNQTERGIVAAGQSVGNDVASSKWDAKIAEDRKHYQQVEADAKEANKLLRGLIHAVLDSATTPEGLAKALKRLKRHLGHDLGLA